MSNEVAVQQKNVFDEMQREAKILSSSDLVPDIYKGGTPKAIANCVIALQMSRKMNLDAFTVMNNMQIVRGKPSFSGKFNIAMLNSCGKFSPLRFKYNENHTSCFAYAKDLDTKEVIQGPIVTIEMAKAEGWMQKAGSKWQTMPDLMLAYRCASFFGSLYAPDLMNGMYTIEEHEDIQRQKRERVVHDDDDMLNKALDIMPDIEDAIETIPEPVKFSSPLDESSLDSDMF